MWKISMTNVNPIIGKVHISLNEGTQYPILIYLPSWICIIM